MSYTNSPPRYKTTLKPKTTPPFCHEWQRASHWEVVISSSVEELASSSSTVASGEEEGKGAKPAMRAYPSYSGVHLTYLINEIVKTSIHPLKLCHDGLQGHTTSRGGKRNWGRRRNSRSCRIYSLHLWLLRSKLDLAPPNGTGADGTHNGEKRRERGIGMEKC